LEDDNNIILLQQNKIRKVKSNIFATSVAK